MSAPRIRRGDFTAQASVYARARPSYPRAFVDELPEHPRMLILCGGTMLTDAAALVFGFLMLRRRLARPAA